MTDWEKWYRRFDITTLQDDAPILTEYTLKKESLIETLIAYQPKFWVLLTQLHTSPHSSHVISWNTLMTHQNDPFFKYQTELEVDWVWIKEFMKWVDRFDFLHMLKQLKQLETTVREMMVGITTEKADFFLTYNFIEKYRIWTEEEKEIILMWLKQYLSLDIIWLRMLVEGIEQLILFLQYVHIIMHDPLHLLIQDSVIKDPNYSSSLGYINEVKWDMFHKLRYVTPELMKDELMTIWFHTKFTDLDFIEHCFVQLADAYEKWWNQVVVSFDEVQKKVNEYKLKATYEESKNYSTIAIEKARVVTSEILEVIEETIDQWYEEVMLELLRRFPLSEKKMISLINMFHDQHEEARLDHAFFIELCLQLVGSWVELDEETWPMLQKIRPWGSLFWWLVFADTEEWKWAMIKMNKLILWIDASPIPSKPIKEAIWKQIEQFYQSK